MSVYDVKVLEIIDHDDGSATISFDMGIEALKVFAAIGLQQCLIDKAKEILDGHSDAEGSGDAGTGEGSDKPVPPEFPGF